MFAAPSFSERDAFLGSAPASLGEHLDTRRRDRVDTAVVVDYEIVGARGDAVCGAEWGSASS